jgi:ABC-2 type transport system ATP-binding protein
MSQPVVQLNHVTKKIGSRTIVDELSFDVMPGEVFGFLGPNGAGKTTTIRMMVGLISISAGEVRIGGYSVARQFEQAMRHVGAIVENPELYKFMSGYQNLEYFARMVPGVTKERIGEVVQLVRLEHAIHQKVSTYSLGMRQRLGVAQAMLHKPSVLILDEPTNGLDPEGIRELRDYLRKLAKEEGIAVIVSSHLLSEMELMCDRVAIIQQGKLLDVRIFKEAHEQGAVMTVRFETDEADEAIRMVRRWSTSVDGDLSAPAIEAVQSAGDQAFTVQLPRERIPELNKYLAAAGVRIYGIATVTKTLEDQFLEVTRGNQIG